MDNILDPSFRRQVTHPHCKIIIAAKDVLADDGLTSQKVSELFSVELSPREVKACTPSGAAAEFPLRCCLE